MNILGIETSSKHCSVAIYSGEQFHHHSKNASREQSQLILPFIDQLIEVSGIKLTELDAIALSIGPGSFTGLRLGMGVVQGLAFSLNIPVIAVSSLAVWAQAAYRQIGAENILLAINAHMGEVYQGEYVLKNKAMVAVTPDALVLPEEIKPNSRQYLVNDASQILPDAVALIDLVLKTDSKAVDISEISLNYLRVETAWKTVEEQNVCRQHNRGLS